MEFIASFDGLAMSSRRMVLHGHILVGRGPLLIALDKVKEPHIAESTLVEFLSLGDCSVAWNFKHDGLGTKGRWGAADDLRG